MCGIFGVFYYARNITVDKNTFKESTNLLNHRGPDGEGFYFDNSANIALGHKRLSIIDLNTGTQPISNEDNSIWIIFNGEIYNYVEIKKELISKGHVFKTKTDTEVIVHAYEEYGKNCTQKLNGIFAFAIWDSKNKSLFLARDHFGVKPLYYVYDKEKIIFSSEIKAILNYQGSAKREINIEALYLCLIFRNIPISKTLINSINKVPPSHYLFLDGIGTLELKSYWNYNIKINHVLSEQEWIELLREKYISAVKRQMMSDVPIGISLSGGLDSTSMLSIMSKNSFDNVYAFTVGFEDVHYRDNEVNRARKNAEKYNAKFYYEIISSKDYLNLMDNYLWHLEEPIGNESALAYYFVAKLAKGTVKVLLNGQGADEIFAGYDRNIGIYYANRIKFIPPSLFKVIEYIPFFPLLRKHQFRRYIDFLNQENDISKIASAASILSNDEKKKLFDNKLSNCLDKRVELDIIKYLINGNIEGSTLEKMLLFDMFSSLSENMLLAEDKMAMAASIEARVPFLDIELATAALAVPTHLKIKNNSGKYIFKKVCESLIPKEVIYQKKIGFKSPLDKWLKKSMGEELIDLIDSTYSITQNYLNKNYVLNMYQEHKRGKVNHQRFLHTLYSIEKWAKIFL